MNSKKETIIITGGTRRIGLAFAEKSIAMGFSVALHYHSSIDKNAEILAERHPGNIFFLQQELEDHPEKLIENAVAMNLKICGLINNASSFTPGDLLDPLHLEKTLSINSIAPVRLSSAYQQLIGRGWIINVTDAHISHPNVKYQNYRISKLLLEEITRQQAVLFAPEIRVNALAPGAMIPANGENSYFDTLKNIVPMKSTGNIAALTDAFSFLVKNDYITGQILRIDGGWGLL